MFSQFQCKNIRTNIQTALPMLPAISGTLSESLVVSSVTSALCRLPTRWLTCSYSGRPALHVIFCEKNSKPAFKSNKLFPGKWLRSCMCGATAFTVFFFANFPSFERTRIGWQTFGRNDILAGCNALFLSYAQVFMVNKTKSRRHF